MSKTAERERRFNHTCKKKTQRTTNLVWSLARNCGRTHPGLDESIVQYHLACRIIRFRTTHTRERHPDYSLRNTRGQQLQNIGATLSRMTLQASRESFPACCLFFSRCGVDGEHGQEHHGLVPPRGLAAAPLDLDLQRELRDNLR